MFRLDHSFELATTFGATGFQGFVAHAHAQGWPVLGLVFYWSLVFGYVSVMVGRDGFPS